jgi:hypothetical protein
MKKKLIVTMKLQYTQLAEGIVAILLTHSNLPAKHLDIRLDLHWTVSFNFYINVFVF